jgi:hypothetical protein
MKGVPSSFQYLNMNINSSMNESVKEYFRMKVNDQIFIIYSYSYPHIRIYINDIYYNCTFSSLEGENTKMMRERDYHPA